MTTLTTGVRLSTTIEYVYDENDESNLEYDENAFNNIITTSDITVDSNAETIDPKEDWTKKWQRLPNVATAINERAAAFAGDVRTNGLRHV